MDESYTGKCGPTFVVPSWTDAGEWGNPSQYATMQLADVNGDGRDELIGLNVDGVEIFWFDTSVGQWRPQTDANGNRQLLTSTDASGDVVSDFPSPPQSRESDPHSPARPQYYSTIHAGDIDGQPGEEILARFWDGMRASTSTRGPNQYPQRRGLAVTVRGPRQVQPGSTATVRAAAASSFGCDL